MVSYGASILISNLKVLTMSHFASNLHYAVVFGSYLFYAVSYVAYDMFLKLPDVHNTFLMQFTTVRFYIVVVTLIAATSLLDLAMYVFTVNEREFESFNRR